MLGQELKEIRQLLNLTQLELSEKLGVTTQTISNYETDSNPIPKVVELALEHIKQTQN